VCGGALPVQRRGGDAPGLSPRVRGSRGFAAGPNRLTGSIPACAGEPCFFPQRQRGIGVYPRVCGGAGDDQPARQPARGLSPRVRGSQLDIFSHVRDSGLSPRVRGSPMISSMFDANAGSIPACAGEPPSANTTAPACRVYPRVCGGARFTSSAGLAPRVYPRVCGGACLWSAQEPSFLGLSPRVRGSQGYPCGHGALKRSIPACAGEPGCRWTGSTTTWVYPRVCGGALPRRGRRHDGRRSGSIPACAGEPAGPLRGVSGIRVYPRVCGGAVESSVMARLPPGLSPRVRGSRPKSRTKPSPRGSIPACAGEPLIQKTLSTPRWVYPRVCGGAGYSIVSVSDRMGLSPRVRGSPSTYPRRPGEERSIPACAGEPRRVRSTSSDIAVYPRVCGGAATSMSRSRSRWGLSPRVRGSRASKGTGGVIRWVYPRVCGGAAAT